MERTAASYRYLWAEFLRDKHLHSYKSGWICINTEHSQLPVNLSKLDQGQQSWKQVAHKTLPSCQHHDRKHSPVCRLPTQAWLFWTGMTASALGQALCYVTPYLCVWLRCGCWSRQTEDLSVCSRLFLCSAKPFFPWPLCPWMCKLSWSAHPLHTESEGSYTSFLL